MAAKALLTTTRIESIDKDKFIVVALNTDNGTLVVHVMAVVEPKTIPIYSFCQAQVATQTSKEIRITAEYSNLFNVFSSNSTAKPLE